jgi:hypothetical protein
MVRELKFALFRNSLVQLQYRIVAAGVIKLLLLGNFYTPEGRIHEKEERKISYTILMKGDTPVLAETERPSPTS